MTKPDQEQIPGQEIKDLLQQAFPAPDAELQRDLWPAMLRKLDQAPVRVPWYDWGLAAVLAGFGPWQPRDEERSNRRQGRELAHATPREPVP